MKTIFKPYFSLSWRQQKRAIKGRKTRFMSEAEFEWDRKCHDVSKKFPLANRRICLVSGVAAVLLQSQEKS